MLAVGAVSCPGHVNKIPRGKFYSRPCPNEHTGNQPLFLVSWVVLPEFPSERASTSEYVCPFPSYSCKSVVDGGAGTRCLTGGVGGSLGSATSVLGVLAGKEFGAKTQTVTREHFFGISWR